MASRDAKAKFDAELKELQKVEAQAQAAGRRVDELAAQLLQARLESSRLDSEVDRFAVGDESAGTLATKAATLARELAGKRAECAELIALLDRALTGAQEAQRAAKVAVIHAEARALAQQKAYAQQLGAELVQGFLDDNRAKLLRLLQVVHLECSLARYKPYAPYAGGFFGIRTLEDLFDTILSQAVAAWEKADPAFGEILGTVAKTDVPRDPVLSSVITSPERGRINTASHGGAMPPTEAALLDAVSQDDTPPPPKPMDQAARSNCIDKLREAQRRLQGAKDSVAYCERQLAGAKDPAEKREATERLARYRHEMSGAEQAVQRWNEMIEADRALTG